MSKAKFILSPANIDSCSYASVDAGADHNALVLERLYRLIKDPKMNLDLKSVLILTSSDESKAVFKAQLVESGYQEINVESVTNVGFEDTSIFMKEYKYLFCANISNFKGTLIDNMLKWVDGKHLTITDNSEKYTKPLVSSRNKISLRYGTLLKRYNFAAKTTKETSVEISMETPKETAKNSRMKEAKKGTKKERDEEVKKETKKDSCAEETIRKPKYTPSIELLRSIVDSSTLCSKVNKGLKLVHSQNQFVQLALQYLINPKNSTTFVILLSLMQLPNGKVLKQKDVTSICNLIDKESGISAFDFFKKYDPNLAKLKHLTSKLFMASERLDIFCLNSISRSMEILLDSMNQKKMLKTFMKDVDQMKKDYSNGQNVNWLYKLTTPVIVQPTINVEKVSLEFAAGTKSEISADKLRYGFNNLNIKNETLISQNTLSVNQKISFKTMPKLKGLDKSVKWLKRL